MLADDIVNEGQTEYLFKMFEGYTAMFPGIAVIIDGLDECPDAQRLAALLSRSAVLRTSSVRILIASQKTSKITAELKDCTQKIDMEDGAIRQLTKSDIVHFVRSELEAAGIDFVLKHINIVTETVVRKADGMFLWAAVAIPTVLAKADLPRNDMHQFLEDIQQLPENIHEFCCHLLDRVLESDPSYGQQDADSIRGILLEILQWAFHAVRPLSINELQDALNATRSARASSSPFTLMNSGQSLDKASTEGLVKRCYPLLYISADTVHIMHPTLTSLVTPLRGSKPPPAVTTRLGDESFQTTIASRCLLYLSQPQFKDFIDFGKKDATDRYHFLKYAVLHWIPHLLNSTTFDASLRKKIADFFGQKQAVTWIEQWNRFDSRLLNVLQSELYSHLDSAYISDPCWIIKLLERSTEIRTAVDPDSKQTRSALVDLGHLYKFHGITDKAHDIFLELFRTDKQKLQENDPELHNTMNTLANIFNDQGKVSEAEQLYKEVLSILEMLEGDWAQMQVIVASNLASAYASQGLFVKAKDAYEDVLDKRIAISGENHQNTSTAHINLANMFLRLSQYAAAKRHLDKAYTICLDCGGLDSLDITAVWSDLASAEHGLGHLDKSLGLSKKAWQRRTVLLGHLHPLVLISGNNYASELCSVGRYDEGIELLRTLLDRQQSSKGDFHPSTITMANNLAEALETQCFFEEGRQLKQACLAKSEKIRGQFHADTILSMNNLAHSHRQMYAFQEAQELLVDCFRRSRNQFGQRHILTINCRSSLSVVCFQLGWHGLTHFLTRRCLFYQAASFGENDQQILSRQLSLASAQRELGDFNEAEKLIRFVVAKFALIDTPNGEESGNAKLALCKVYRMQGKYRQAAELAHSLISQWSDTNAPAEGSKRQLLIAKDHLVLALMEQSELNQSLTLAQEVVDLARQTFRQEEPMLERELYLAEVYLQMGQAAKAELLADPILPVWRKVFGDNHGQTASLLSLLSRCYREQQRFREAEDLGRQALAALSATLGPLHPHTLRSQYRYALLLLDMGEKARAEQLMVETLAKQKAFLRAGHPHIVDTVTALRSMVAASEYNQEAMLNSIPAFVRDINSEKEALLLRTLKESSICLGENDPETLVVKFEMGLFFKSTDRTDEALSILTTTLIEQERAQEACHEDTLRTLVEVIAISGNKSKLQEKSYEQCIHTAIRINDLALLEQLLHHGANTKVKDPVTDLSPLSLATKIGDETFVRALLRGGIDADMLETDGTTALHHAISRGHIKVAETLVTAGANPKIMDLKEGRSCFYRACFLNREHLLRVLLQGHFDPNTAEDVPPMHVSAGYNRFKLVELLLESGADLECASPTGDTPLLNAVRHGHPAMVEFLLSKGADLHCKNKDGCGPLHMACIFSHVEITKYLVAKGCDVNEPMPVIGLRPVHIAVEESNTAILETLLRAGASSTLPSFGKDPFTPLATAARVGNLDILRRLLKEEGQSVNVRVQPSINNTALHIAAHFGQESIVKELLKLGADPDCVNSIHSSPLIMAVNNAHYRTVQALLDAGADSNIGIPDVTALGVALLRNHVEIAATLLANPNTNVEGEIFEEMTPIFMSVLKMQESLVDALLARHADTSSKRLCNEVTPLHLAVQQKASQIVRSIVRSGANQSIRDIFGLTAADWATEDCLPLLSSALVTPMSRRLVTTKATIVRTSNKIQTKLGQGLARRGGTVTDLMRTITTGLLLLGNTHDAQIAAESCIMWTTKNSTRMIRHASFCDGCRTLEPILGTAHWCSRCAVVALCQSCFENHSSNTQRCSMCPHDGPDFLQVPRDYWYQFEDSDIVDTDAFLVPVQTLDDWLASLCDVYSDESEQLDGLTIERAHSM